MRLLILTVTLLVAIAAAGQEIYVTPTSSLSLPAGQITGVTWAGADTLVVLVVGDDTAGWPAGAPVHMIATSAAGQEYWREDFTGVLTRGLTWDGEFFWSSGDDTDGGALLYKLKVNPGEVDEVYPARGHRPTDMAFDGTYVWVSDRDNGRLDRIDPESGDLTRSVGAPGFSPGGLAWDGEAIWVADAGTGRLTRMHGNRLQRRRQVATESWFRLDQDALLAHDGSSLWMLADDESVLRRLRRDR